MKRQQAGAASIALTPHMAEFLRRLAINEQNATGPDRRPAFRLTRVVIAAALDHRVPARQIAECLGTSASSVRSRVSRANVELTVETVEQLTGLTSDQIRNHPGNISTTPSGNYLAADIVSMLLSV